MHFANARQFEGDVKVLILPPGAISSNRAGPAVRSLAFAEMLARSAMVTVAAPKVEGLSTNGFRVVPHNGRQNKLQELVREHDVILNQGLYLLLVPREELKKKYVVIDLYDPFVLENLNVHAMEPRAERERNHRRDLTALLDQISLGDFFLCAHEKQLDFWMGVLTAANRVNPSNSDHDPSFRNLLASVPSGLSSSAPARSRAVLRGVHPKLHANDSIVLWLGGMWDWLDPLTLIRAVARLVPERPHLRLVLPGAHSPDPNVPRMRMVNEARSLSRKLRLEANVVFIPWVPYEDRADYLLEADLGVSMQHDHAETRYAIRTRVLDYIWARLPMVLSKGDYLAEICADAGVASLVPPGDDAAAAAAISKMLEAQGLRDNLRDSFEPLVRRFSWEEVTKPLVDYCARPRFAADRVAPHTSPPVLTPLSDARTPLWQLPLKVLIRIRHRGLRGLSAEVRAAIARRRMST